MDQEAAELRGQLALTEELLAELRHQRGLLEAQLAEAQAAERDLRQLLLAGQPAVLPAAGGSGPDPREPTLGEWWRDIDRLRRLGASLVLSAVVSFTAAAGFHFLLAAHLISPFFRLGYIFALLGIVLLIAGIGMLF
jgi:hypothetical protein